MITLKTLFVFLVSMAPTISIGQTSNIPKCLDLQNGISDALAQRDLAMLRHNVDRISISSGCDQSVRDWSRQAAARAITQMARAAMTAGQNLKSQEELLRLALSYAPVWQAAAWLGDIAYDERLYADAAVRYQDALNIINDAHMTPEAPPLQIIESLFYRGEITKLVADHHIVTPKTRSGVPGGTSSPSIRGFVPKKVMVPVEFKFNSSEFTDRGNAAAIDLMQQLLASSPAAITIIGHTDPKGSHEHNRQLSLRRAIAVRDYLIAHNFLGTISVEGHGEDDPIKLDDPSHFTTEQYHQILRRVEVRK